MAKCFVDLSNSLNVNVQDLCESHVTGFWAKLADSFQDTPLSNGGVLSRAFTRRARNVHRRVEGAFI